MRFLIDLAVAFAVAVIVGVGSAWFAVDRGTIFGAVSAGGWTAWPQEGSADADPYTLAMLARTGEVPLGAGEGLSFTATRDVDGNPLSGRCDYDVAGNTPAARLWTLTAYDDDGALMANVAGRPGFHSREIVRDANGDFRIRLSAVVQPGNWLPIGAVDRFRLELRLYDTPLTTGSQLTELTMPAIRKVACS
ncbi:MAG TPA: DUF1214 domain-containing protein [Bauldia sp.]|nr:DUF1214 domain-containing protein [Bauldia sp.]